MHFDHTEGTVPFSRVLWNWDIGKARTCKHCGECYGTRKELRIHQKQIREQQDELRKADAVH